MEIRVAATEDAEEIRAVYAPYVINTAVSFEYDVPTIEEFKMRIDNTLKMIQLSDTHMQVHFIQEKHISTQLSYRYILKKKNAEKE